MGVSFCVEKQMRASIFFAYSLSVISISLFETECIFSEKDKFSKSYETSSDVIENLYDKIYVISLDRTPERYAHVKKQLDKFNLKHERFSAVDGKLITVKDMERNQTISWQKIGPPNGYYQGADLKISYHSYKDAEFHYIIDKCLLNFGELGCAMSHRAVWADVVKHKYKKAIILEDDVTLEDNFLRKLSLIMKNLPDDFDVFFLDTGSFVPHTTYFTSPYFWLSKFSNTPSPYYAKVKQNNAKLKLTHKNVRLWGTHAYIVTCDTAKKLLEKTEYLHRPIDITMMISGLNLYVSKVKLLAGNYNDSTISNRKKDNKK
ncbi:MAG: glycosyltransferase family 25 protein [Alphaproteobacteria bacterium]|nr:glycosyltransferase family 25 protein [Alphaproteobacteria bacterium]